MKLVWNQANINWSMSNHKNAHYMRLHHTRAAHLQFGQLEKPHADVMLNQQKAIKPRTQDGQRKSL